ncbi:toll-like receptor Tollo [Lepeophtheirus salmonis]|uniref:toll-like receptor Tollo n=1 Tax=Lepeophtheirus salmonis TaxID=72036 RepID=UPI001AE6EBC2|nr:toll-like receptor Tollo [Lepeophtheirus salmonis]
MRIDRGHRYGTALIHILFLIILGGTAESSFGDSSSSSSNSQAYRNCSFEPKKEILKCSIQSLDFAVGNSTNTASYSKASVLEFTCSQIYFLESNLRSGHFGHLPTLKELRIQGCPMKKIPSGSFQGLGGLTSLSVVTQDSLELDSERAFEGLDHLRSLNLSHNNLWSVPPGTFCRLSGLSTLNLSFNRLQDMHELSFSPSKRSTSCKLPLENLILSDNSYVEIPSQALSHVSKLETLELSSNAINLVQDNAFDNLRDLKYLSLANNQLIALPPHTFAPTPHLRELSLQNNSLGVLAPKIFSGLSRLLVLNVSRNEIGNEWLTPALFASLVRLVSLDLSHNRISSLDPSVLRPLTSLQILDLSHNLLTTLDSGTFLSQNNLHILRLNHNDLKSLHARSFDGLSVVSSINLDSNALSALEENAFSDCCSTLNDLTLSNNRFSRVPDGLQGLDGLKTLDLGGNNIKEIHNGSFTGLRALYGLKLSSNGITNISESIFKPIPGVQVLNLAFNKIKSLGQGVFNKLRNLKMLRLDGNELIDINGLLSGQEELQWLNVSGNRLQWFDYAFIPKNLELLDIHGNQIENLGNYYKLTDQFELKTLDASHNKIKKLETLSFPKSIQVANLNHNRIRLLTPGMFRDKIKLRKVDLSHNYLKRLQISSFNIAPYSESTSIQEEPRPHFYMGHNPLHCDCEMEWFKNMNEMTQARLPIIMDYSSIQCHGDSSTSILDIPNEHFLCQYEAHCFSLCMCCDFFACDCRMQCPEGCDCYHDSSWSVNVIQCSHRNHALVPPLIPMDATNIYMDGNNFTGLLDTQSFIGRKRISSMFLNNSNIGGIDNQTFNGLMELKILHLEDNQVQRLEGYEFVNISSLQELYLHRNRIEYIHERTFDNLLSLRILTLDGNNLISTSIWEFPLLSSLQDLTSITLSNNPWSCKCEFVQKFQNFIAENRDVFSDISDTSCLFEDGYTTVSLARNLTCSESMAVVRRSPEESSLPPIWRNIIPTLIIVSAIFVILAMLLAILFAFRTPLRVWLHSKYGIRICDSRKDLGANDKLYDAFVSYSLKDEEFVHSILLPQLEARNGNIGYKLCLQHRDLRSNTSIADTFPSASHLCCQHILIISKNYLETEWSQIKFVLPKKWNPLMVMIEELSSLDLAAAPEFNLLTKTCPLVRWGETGFWNKLRFYLPDASEYRRHCVSPPPELNGMKYPAASGWHYDGLMNSNNSSSTSTRSTVAGGSPRNTDVGSDDAIQILNNPLENVRGWGGPGVHAVGEHTYQSIGSDTHHHPVGGGAADHQSHIYHTLEPLENHIQVDDGHYDALGTLDVMLPNGQMVPATLVRNASGRIVPLVNAANKTMPHRPGSGKSPGFHGHHNTKSPVLSSFSSSSSNNNSPHKSSSSSGGTPSGRHQLSQQQLIASNRNKNSSSSNHFV